MIECSAEELANRVLKQIKEKYGKIKYPIDPFKLLKDEKVIVTTSDFENLEGIILKDDDGVVIVGINKNRRYQRQRFTAAHEYCHFIKDLGNDKSSIECLKNSKAKLERYADDFASRLLMPTNELIKQCDKYKDKNGYISFENITYIAEYFGVSFRACVNRIAYDLHQISGEISPQNINRRIQEYKPETKRKELIKNTKDKEFLDNIIDSLSHKMIEVESIVGARFLNNYIYNDNRIEGINISKNEVTYLLGDLYINKENSEFFNIEDESIVMTLGNYALQEYVINTIEEASVLGCSKMHSLLNSYTPYPEYAGFYRRDDAVIRKGRAQPVLYTNINEELNKLEEKLKEVRNNKDKYSVSEYINIIVPLIHKFTIIHPFSDGNGRISRALLNWILKEKRIPPIYIDTESRTEYLDALSLADKTGDCTSLVILIEKRVIGTLTEMHCYPYFK